MHHIIPQGTVAESENRRVTGGKSTKTERWQERGDEGWELKRGGKLGSEGLRDGGYGNGKRGRQGWRRTG